MVKKGLSLGTYLLALVANRQESGISCDPRTNLLLATTFLLLCR